MLALALAAALFVYWGLTGYAALRALGPRTDTLRYCLLAPCLGLCLTLLPAFLLNRQGLPIASVARWQCGFTLVLAILILRWRGAAPPSRWLAAFGLIAATGLLAVAWPLLTHSFDWLAVANDDMANYVLGAERFARFGFFTSPNPADIVPTTRDATQWYWFLHVVGGVRPGSEMLLAWVLSVAGLSGVAVYMPVMAALHLTLVFATAALVMASAEQRIAGFWTAALLAVNPLIALGLALQLIAQDFGLALLATATALLCVPLETIANSGRGGWPRFLALAIIVLASFVLVYPELVPFLGLAFIAYHGARTIRNPRRAVPVLALVAIGLVGAAVLLQGFLLDLIVFLFEQFTHAVGGGGSAVRFPYFLVPSGLAAFWGFAWFTGFGATNLFVVHLLHSLAILAGILMMLVLLAATAWMVRRLQPAALITATACALAVLLFSAGAGFGLFKLAMFAQPFVIGTLALAWCELAWRWRIA